MFWWSKFTNSHVFNGRHHQIDNHIVEISRNFQYEVSIEKNTIHDLEFAKTLQRLKREIKFPTKLEDFVAIIEYANV